jgi:uroporphyrinogen-III synthase
MTTQNNVISSTPTNTVITTKSTTSTSNNENVLSFYKRQLPAECVAFDSDAGIQLFSESLASNNMKSYFKLASVFQTQNEPAYCGLATVKCDEESSSEINQFFKIVLNIIVVNGFK